jgi:hypothetical protein
MPFETTVLPDVAPDSADAPPFWEPEPAPPPEPTQMMDAVHLEQDPPRRVPEPQPPSVFPPQGPPVDAPATAAPTDAFGPGGDDEQVSAIDALFGESQFREYTDGLDPSQNPFVRQAEAAAHGGVVPGEPAGPGGPSGPAPGVSRLQRVLLIVLGSALAILAIIALFFLGMRLPDLLGPSPTVAGPTGTPSPSASPSIPLGPVAPGEYAWNELLGGECLDPFESAWQDRYTVVDCAVPHPAQMIDRGVIPEPAQAVDLYPGEEALQTQVLALCRGPGIFDPALAGKVTDAVVLGSYPTAEVWAEGGRDYFCFVTRSSGEPITGTLTLPQVAPTPAP